MDEKKRKTPRLCLSCCHWLTLAICGYTDYDWKKTIFKNQKCPLYKEKISIKEVKNGETKR